MPEAVPIALRMAGRFRARVLKRERLLGTFIKTAAASTVEIVALAGFDFVVLDAEHAPFDLSAIEIGVLAGLGAGVPVLVRVPPAAPAMVGAVLDAGAAGIVMPHVADAGAARQTVSLAKFGNGGARGLSPSARAGGYGALPFADFAALSDRSVTVWVQIEDSAALDHLAPIAATPDVDCLFVGRVDLAQAFSKTAVDDATVRDATLRAGAAARTAGKAGALFVGSADEAKLFVDHGFGVFVVGSDQSYLKAQASAHAKAFDALRQM